MRLANVIHAVDTHVCGEPGRVIVGGVLDVPGATMFEKRLHLEEHADGLRKRMLREPRATIAGRSGRGHLGPIRSDLGGCRGVDLAQ